MVSLEWPSTTLLVVEPKSGNKLSRSLKKRFSLRTLGKWEKEYSAVERSCKQLTDPCASGQPASFKSLNFVPLGKLRKEQSGGATEIEKKAMNSVLGAFGYLARESRPDLSGPVSILRKVASTELSCRTSKKQIVWSDWLRHTQISHCQFAKFLSI